MELDAKHTQNSFHPSPCSNLQVRGEYVGRDLLIQVSGGAAHIGAVAMAYYTSSDVVTEILTAPGHREGELAAELAEQAARMLHCTVTVVAGIHIPNATREQIHDIVKETRRLAAEELAKWRMGPDVGAIPCNRLADDA